MPPDTYELLPKESIYDGTFTHALRAQKAAAKRKKEEVAVAAREALDRARVQQADVPDL